VNDTPKQLLSLLRTMWIIRAFEEKVSELYAANHVVGLLHLGIGQEGVAVGVCGALRAKDVVFGSHRSHGHAIAKGADPKLLMAELAGRVTGYCRGKGGSMHVVAQEAGFVTASGIVGGTIPLALGAAFVSKERAEKNVAAVFFGDGAGQTGAFHESLNIASLWKLPVIFVCENNGYAEFTPLSSHTLVERLARHAETYGIPRVTVDGNDILAVRKAVDEAARHARAGNGATFVECLTHRLRGHYEGDPANPNIHQQPVMCMHCENAPCEPVCPVAATLHDHEGLNTMVYNRCIGTRYCSNNCPYKVRRFNFLQYSDLESGSLKLQRNPSVSVRARGVMEKCTYCVQRISAARIRAKKEERPIADGEVVTACQAACPTRAIVFGDINDPDSQVAQLKTSPLNYGMLTELNTNPRTSYLAKVRNPNPELEGEGD